MGNDRKPRFRFTGGIGRARGPATGLAVTGLLAASVVALGTQAAFAGTEDFRVVFEANNQMLAGYSSSGSNFVSGLGMLAGTSPSVAQLADGTYEAAFEDNDDFLAFSHLGGGTLVTTLGMEAGTSPSIASLPGGGFIAAFEDNDDQLYLYDSNGDKINTGMGMAPETDPAIAVQSNGSYRVVIQDNDYELAGYSSSGSNYTTTLGMDKLSSPSLAALSDGTYEAAFEANNNNLTLSRVGGATTNTSLGMLASTNPSIAAGSSDDDFRVVFQDNDQDLAGYSSSGASYTTTQGMMLDSSPSITPLTDGTYEAAFETNDAELAVSHVGGGWASTDLGMYQGTSPAIAIPAPSAPSTVAANIAALANANLGKGAGYCSQKNAADNSLGGDQFLTSCSGNGGEGEYWCADFAAWVWQNAGVNITGLTPAAASFYTDASENGSTVHSSSSYAPQVGDVAVYGYSGGEAEHNGIVVAVNSDGSIVTDNGDWGGAPGDVSEAEFAQTSSVIQVDIAADQKYVGDTPSGIEDTISYWVTPSGLS
jgi:CHAP domain